MSAHAICQSFSRSTSGAANTCSASSTQVMLSRRIRSRNLAIENVTMSPDGSATPLASSRMYSGCSGRSMVATTDSIKSSRIVQHTHPFARLITSPSTPTTSSASMLIDPKSLTSTATRSPWSPRRMRFRSVVLPAPRKPVRTVSGTDRRRPTVRATASREDPRAQRAPCPVSSRPRRGSAARPARRSAAGGSPGGPLRRRR